VHWMDVAHSDILGADDVDGLSEGAIKGADDGAVVRVDK